MGGTWAARHEPGARDTIFALSTPLGRSAVAVIRLSGPRAGDTLRRLTGRTVRPREATFARFRDPFSGTMLDEGLALWFPAPASFTGEDCAELQIHGSVATIRAAGRLLARFDGVREAKAGEFTQRALENGKVDLAQTEALADLIDAQTERQRTLALRAKESGPARLAEVWRTKIVDALAEIEARLDFADEGDVDLLQRDTLVSHLRDFAAALEDSATQAERAGRVRQGYVVAICGPPNSGKSTLLNALTGRDQAIVSPHPGTTRDTIEVALDLEGSLVTICDTAGIRQTDDPIETIGVDRAFRAARAADFTLWLEAPDARAEPDAAMRVDFRALSKADSHPVAGGTLQISALTGENLDTLVGILSEHAGLGVDESGDAEIFRERHLVSLRNLAKDVAAAADYVAVDASEIGAAALCDALAEAEALGSKTADNDVLDRIFARFCIGK